MQSSGDTLLGKNRQMDLVGDQVARVVASRALEANSLWLLEELSGSANRVEMP